MAALNKRWHGENIMMRLHIGNDLYISYMINENIGQNPYDPTYIVPDSREKFIQSINIDDTDGNNNVNPLGIISSDRVTITCYDKNYSLSPANRSGYGSQLTNGQKLELFIQDNSRNWHPFGVYYTTSFHDVYNEGAHGLTTICAEDRINILGNMEIPVLPVYANITAQQLVVSLFTALGITQNEYYIDPELNMDYIWGVLPGTKIRDFLNSLCQRIFARIIIDDDGVIKFVPALTLGTNYNTVTLTADDIGDLKNLNSDNINYSKISVKYYVYGQDALKVLHNESGLTYDVGHVTVDSIVFSDVVVSINNVVITYKSSSNAGRIRNVEYVAYQNGMILEFDVVGAQVNNVEIYVEGYVANNNTKKQTIDIDTGSREGLQEYTFEPRIQMEDSEALTLCTDIRNYMQLIDNRIELDGTLVTPFLSVGDRVILDVTNVVYAGTYMVKEVQLDISESYSCNLKLLRIE